MFDHPDFDQYTPETFPLDTDIYLRDEKFMAEYEQAFLDNLAGKEWQQVGYVCFAAVRKVTERTIELSWFADPFIRHHEVFISLPRDQVVTCIGIYKWDENPSIFVKSTWLDSVYRRIHCVFGYVDAIGMRKALEAGLPIHERLPMLRAGLDKVAEKYPQIAFFSFADSVLLKSDWTTGAFTTEHRPYEPEIFLQAFRDIRVVFRGVLDLNVFGVFTQGSNEFFNSSTLHISETENHVCFNSLGAPFADLKTIETSVRYALKNGLHEPYELYLDETFHRSLRRKLPFETLKARRFSYNTKIQHLPSSYVCAQYDELVQ